MATIGCDLASVDQDGDPDWDLSRIQGYLRLVDLRLAEGLTPDPDYPRYRAQLAARGVPVLPYLLLTLALATPEEQADRALAVLGPPDPRGTLPLALDVEGSRRGLSAGAWRDWVVRAHDQLRLGLSVDPVLYSSRVYWQDSDGMAGLPAPELVESPGWWKLYPQPVRSAAVYDPAAVDRLAPPSCAPETGTTACGGSSAACRSSPTGVRAGHGPGRAGVPGGARPSGRRRRRTIIRFSPNSPVAGLSKVT